VNLGDPGRWPALRRWLAVKFGSAMGCADPRDRQGRPDLGFWQRNRGFGGIGEQLVAERAPSEPWAVFSPPLARFQESQGNPVRLPTLTADWQWATSNHFFGDGPNVVVRQLDRKVLAVGFQRAVNHSPKVKLVWRQHLKPVRGCLPWSGGITTGNAGEGFQRLPESGGEGKFRGVLTGAAGGLQG